LTRAFARGLNRALMRMPPAALLGQGHPLARDVESLDVVARHAVAVLAAVLCGVVGALAGEPWGVPVLLGGTATLAGFGAAAAALRGRTRQHALMLVLEGHEGLPLPAVERERRRLLGAKERRRLSRGLLTVAREAQRPPPFAPFPVPPVFVVEVVREVAPDLRRLATALQAEPPNDARAVALVERLLRSGLSPLYGADADALRAEVRRLEYLLSGR
jgi:hypothetical protein